MVRYGSKALDVHSLGHFLSAPATCCHDDLIRKFLVLHSPDPTQRLCGRNTRHAGEEG